MLPTDPAELRQAVLQRLYQLIDDIEAERLTPLAYNVTAEREKHPDELFRISLLVRRQAGAGPQPT
jgi:hypothetical protein